ncbi:MAG: HEAT repeat domain-containing protein [Candidatus Omnitrophica bacterium]|nr:HEAT repeat domain-containing protein [Candidatus Omnitrophota bacterium]
MPTDDTPRKRKLSAIMFTDMSGYSAKFHDNEESAIKLLEKYTLLITSIVKEFEGKVLKIVGDGFLVDFSSAVNAVQCALKIQDECYQHNKKNPNEKLLIRIGVHLGDVVIMEDDIIGDGVNIASRIEPFADPGGICISRDVYSQVQGKLDIQVVSLGPTELKNIKNKVEIYKILVESVAEISSDMRDKNRFFRTNYSKTFKFLFLFAIILVCAMLLQVTRSSNLSSRKNVAGVMKQLGPERALLFLSNALQDPDWQVRGTAAQALGELKEIRATEVLIAALKDKVPFVRRSAAWALGETQDSRASEALVGLMNDSDAEVRKNAAKALVKIAERKP